MNIKYVGHLEEALVWINTKLSFSGYDITRLSAAGPTLCLNLSHQLNSSQIVAEANEQLSASRGDANRVTRSGIDSLIPAKLQIHLASLLFVPPSFRVLLA
jgi:hypothetical protein